MPSLLKNAPIQPQLNNTGGGKKNLTEPTVLSTESRFSHNVIVITFYCSVEVKSHNIIYFTSSKSSYSPLQDVVNAEQDCCICQPSCHYQIVVILSYTSKQKSIIIKSVLNHQGFICCADTSLITAKAIFLLPLAFSVRWLLHV